MGDSTPFPSPAAIARAELFTRERFVYEGETLEDALAPGPRAAGRSTPPWPRSRPAPSSRRSSGGAQFSLLLGLERLLSEEEPHLVDGTVLSAHQVDALSGTLTALLAEAQRSAATATGTATATRQRPRRARQRPPPHGDRRRAPTTTTRSSSSSEDEPEDEEPQDWQDDDEVDEDVSSTSSPRTPTPPSASGSSTPPAPARRSPRSGFVEASRTGGVLILTHRRNLVDQFHGELRDRGYRDRISRPAARRPRRRQRPGHGRDLPVVRAQRRAGSPTPTRSSSATRPTPRSARRPRPRSARWAGPVFIGMTATGALIARHVTDLFPTQTSRFDLAQAARRGVIAPLRCIRIPPGPGVRTIAKVPLRRGEVDTEFDQEMLAELLDQTPFNLAIADLYKTRFNGVPGVVYAAGVKHAYNVAAGVPRPRDQGPGASPARRPSASWRGSWPTTSRARSTCWSTPSCWPRAGTARGRRSACTWRRPPPSGSTSSASAASPAAIRARRPGSSSTSSTRRPSTTTRW